MRMWTVFVYCTQDENGQCMFDTSAIHKNANSSKNSGYRCKPRGNGTPNLPNGQIKRAYSTSVLPLRLSEWQGKIILGLPWHRENRPVIHWDTMIYEVEQNGKMRKIFPSADSKFIDTEKIMSPNMINSRQAKKALKRKGTELALYWFRNATAKEDGTDAYRGGCHIP